MNNFNKKNIQAQLPHHLLTKPYKFEHKAKLEKANLTSLQNNIIQYNAYNPTTIVSMDGGDTKFETCR